MIFLYISLLFYPFSVCHLISFSLSLFTHILCLLSFFFLVLSFLISLPIALRSSSISLFHFKLFLSTFSSVLLLTHLTRHVCFFCWFSLLCCFRVKASRHFTTTLTPYHPARKTALPKLCMIFRKLKLHNFHTFTLFAYDIIFPTRK